MSCYRLTLVSCISADGVHQSIHDSGSRCGSHKFQAFLRMRKKPHFEDDSRYLSARKNRIITRLYAAIQHIKPMAHCAVKLIRHAFPKSGSAFAFRTDFIRNFNSGFLYFLLSIIGNLKGDCIGKGKNNGNIFFLFCF